MICWWHVCCAARHLGAVVEMWIRCRRCWCWRDTSGVLSIAGWIRSKGPSCRNCRSFTKSKLESLRATIFCMSGQAKRLANVTIVSNGNCLPSQSISPRKSVAAQGALVVFSFEMYTIVVTVEVCLALEFLGTLRSSNHRRAGMRIFAIRIVRLHMWFPVVASLEKFSTDCAFVCSFLGSGSPAPHPGLSPHIWRHPWNWVISNEWFLPVMGNMSDVLWWCAQRRCH